MKNYLMSLGILSAAFFIEGCKKDHSFTAPEAPVGAEPMVIYKAPDTTNAVAGHYFVTFKESFKMPFAKVYNGSKTIRGAKEAAAIAYNQQARTDMRAQLTNANGSMIVHINDIDAFVSNVVVGFSAQLSADAVKKLVANPNVQYVEYQNSEMTDADATETKLTTKAYSPQAQIIDPLRTAVGFKNGWQRSQTVTIWIIDGGCDLDHPDLKVYTPWARSFSNDPTAEDRYGHGTKVAGVLAAIDNGFGTRGVAAGAYIVPIKITDTPRSSRTANFVKALDYIWSKCASSDVVNISQSFNASSTSVASMEAAIRSYSGYDIWFAIAAGNNSGFASQRSPARMGSPEYPYAETLGFIHTVSSHGAGYKFSSIFPGGGGSNYGAAIDCAAPGENIYTTAMGGGYTDDVVQGTSFAAPIVAGILFMNNGVYYKKATVTGDVDNYHEKVAFLNY